MRCFSLALVCLIAASFITSASAQFRQDASPVLTPNPTPSAASVPDPAEPLLRRYGAAGRPRIALFWNIALGDTLVNRQRTVETTAKSASGSKTSMRQSTAGAASDATQSDEDTSEKALTTTTREVQSLDDAKRQNGMREAPAAVLENAFTSELGRAGLVLVDRALTMRKTAAGIHRAGADARLVETDAIVANADLLLEVLMVEDKQAPTGWGFNVRGKNVRQGTLLFAFYTTATPPARVTPGRWTTNEQGFAYQPGETLPPTVGESGVALARKVMEQLTERLPTVGDVK